MNDLIVASAKLGPLQNVIFVSRAAYIVFASKDSVDKALSLTGTSFFSRKLMVWRNYILFKKSFTVTDLQLFLGPATYHSDR